MNRRLLPVVASVAALPLVLAACTTTVSGNGIPGRALGAHSTPSPGASTSGTTTSAPGGTVTATDLAGKLEAPPAGSSPWSSSWGALTTPTTEQFVQHVYAAASQATAQSHLEAQGIAAIAHRTWYATDSDQADDILLGFATEDGAHSRFLSATSAQSAGGRTEVTVSGVDDALGYTDAAQDSLGNVRTVFYVQRGTVVVELFYYSPAKYREADATAWLTQQVALLG